MKRDALSDKMKHTGAKYTTKCNVKSIILFLLKEMLKRPEFGGRPPKKHWKSCNMRHFGVQNTAFYDAIAVLLDRKRACFTMKST